ESVRMLRDRVVAALHDHASEAGATLVVCHAGVVRAALSRGEDEDSFQTAIGFGETRTWPRDGDTP
ncbi:MAG: histidine phosphatase family protein, partial [Pseudomonadota bacterium]